MDIPHALITDVQAGNAILLLGAGASFECRDKNGNQPPLGKELGKLIANRFLGPSYADMPLDQISELAISETDLVTVQDYIKEVFIPFSPTQIHELLTTFRWRAIATTNYDLILEKAYENNPKSPQKLVPFISDGENVDRKIRSNNDLQYLKLHGCISRISSSDPPLILTADQYVQYRDKRNRLFSRLKEMASDRPIIFVGYGVRDSDIRKLLIELDKEIHVGRPRYYSVLPTFTGPEKRFWEEKRITPLEGTFSDFFECLDSKIGNVFRGLTATSSVPDIGISKRFTDPKTKLTPPTMAFLQTDVTVVNDLSVGRRCNPRLFYRGMERGWEAIEANLDISRKLNDTILERYVLEDEDRDDAELVLVKGPAGSGKSVLIRRVAWKVAKEFNCLALYMNETGIFYPASIVEIARACGERLYLFLEDILPHQRDVERFIRSAKDMGIRITIIGGVRTNELNAAGGELENLATESFELHYLSEKEIRDLLSKLEEHNSLDQLQRFTPEERFEKLCKKAGRQLLVALHEATHGQPFETIICDEFRKITPSLAKRIYRTICVLYRFGTPVRAGLIKRVHGVGFDEFRQKFLGPLEKVVRVASGRTGEDISYVARHQLIAEIVFLHALDSVDERLQATLEVLAAMDLDYSSDKEAFYHILRGRAILELFPDRTMAKRLFTYAEEKSQNDSIVLHQRAIYEMNHKIPDLALAESYLQRALDADGSDRIVRHSLSELSLKRALGASNPLVKKQLLGNAENICRQLLKQGASSYERHTIVKIQIERLKLELQLGELNDEDLTDMLQEIEKELGRHLAAVPGDEYLLSAESQLANFLAETSRAVNSLMKAFSKNPRSTYLALTLARLLVATKDLLGAEKILRDALELNPTEKRLHYLLGKVLLDLGNSTDSEMLYHFQRSFVPGDGNLDAHLLFARQKFLVEGGKAAKPVFSELKRTAYVGQQQRIKPMYPLAERKFGRVVDHQANYAFLSIDGSGDWVYAHESAFCDVSWDNLTYGAKVSFGIAFAINGLSAFEVKIE